MATYRLIHLENQRFGSYTNAKSYEYKKRSDSEARNFAQQLMREHGWKYVIVERKYKDTFRAVAKYTNPKFYVCFHEYFGGVYVANYDQTKEFGEDYNNAEAYAKAMNEKLNIQY